MTRRIYKVRWNRATGKWCVLSPENPELEWPLDSLPTKASAVFYGAGWARDYARNHKAPTQLRVYTKRGTISFERTYLRDPKKSRG